jgi:hypothetical protein
MARLLSNLLRLTLLASRLSFSYAKALPALDNGPTDTSDVVRFQSKLQPDVGLRIVRNSGVCETTPGVNQISGYADIGTDMSMVRNSFPPA